VPRTGKGVAFWIRIKLAESKDAQGPGQRFHIQEVGELIAISLRAAFVLTNSTVTRCRERCIAGE